MGCARRERWKVAVAAALAVGALAPGVAAAGGARLAVFGGLGAAGFTSALFGPAGQSGGCCADGVAAAELAPSNSLGRGLGWSAAIGAVGRLGSFGGGGEVLTASDLAVGGDSGYSGIVTYAGFDARVIAELGVGIGALWRLGDDAGASFAGSAHARLGVRIDERWAVLGRTDLAGGGNGLGVALTVGLSWMPR